MRPRATRLNEIPLAIALLMGLAATLGSSCTSPSSQIDGGDLLGVFSHDASPPDAGPHGRREAHRRDAGHDDNPSPAPSQVGSAASVGGATAQVPSEGACVPEGGVADHDVRRTLGRPPCRGAQVFEWRDGDGAPRYACVYAPPGVETRAPLPLIVFFHGPEDDPSSVEKKTALRKLNATTNLSGDAAHTGFIVLAPQGRHLKGGRLGSVFETDYLGQDNVDVATVDHFIGELEGRGFVDRRRLYTMGASYGGHMAATYAMMRPDRVAAFGAFATDAPRATWSCSGPPPPGLVQYRACDAFFSCESVERWLRARDAEGAETTPIRLGMGNEEEPNCATRNKCTRQRGQGNHGRWPKGRETDFLGFFARHALGVGR